MRDGLIAWGIPAARVHCIPNAWADPTPFSDRSEARRVLGIADDAWCAGFVGRIGREKGPDIFVEALGQVVLGRSDHSRRDDEAMPSVSGMLIGTGRMRDDLMQRTRMLGLVDNIMWPGAIEGAGRLLRAFDVVVLSSRTEGTPMVLLEAMAAGVPVIATRVGGIPDVVSEHEAALVQPESPDALASALLSVIRHVDSTRQRAERATQRLHGEFGADLWLQRYDSVYRSCVSASAMATV